MVIPEYVERVLKHRLMELGLTDVEATMLYITQDFSEESMETLVDGHLVKHMQSLIVAGCNDYKIDISVTEQSALSDDFISLVTGIWLTDTDRSDVDVAMATFNKAWELLHEYFTKRSRHKSAVMDALKRKKNLQ